MTASAVKEKDTLPAWMGEGLPERLDRELLARAYRFSERAHEGQKRLSGDKYVSHCVEVAKILVDLQLDSTTVASGLIHDVVEDTAATVDDIVAAARVPGADHHEWRRGGERAQGADDHAVRRAVVACRDHGDPTRPAPENVAEEVGGNGHHPS